MLPKLPSWSWLVSFLASLLLCFPASSSAFLPPLQEAWTSIPWSVSWPPPDVAPLLGWQPPPLLLYCVPAGLGGFVLPDPLWPSAKRKQNLDLKASLWAIPILDQALSVDPTPPGKWEKKKKSSIFCVPHGVASNQDRIISGAQKSLHTPKFLPYLLTDAWNYFHRKQHALFHN